MGTLKRLAKQLRRELKAHPGRATILGVLLLVGVYFWGPILWGSSKSKAPGDGQAIEANAPNVALDPSDATAKKTQGFVAWPWDETIAAIERDPRMRTATGLGTLRNPFAATPKYVAHLEKQKANEDGAKKAGADSQKKKPVKVEVTPESVGLVLTSTMVGGRRSVATVNGKLVKIGDLITASTAAPAVRTRARSPAEKDKSKNVDREPDASPQAIAFRLVGVNTKSVVLLREGKKFELKMKENELFSRRKT
jgi:hypothetical protein